MNDVSPAEPSAHAFAGFLCFAVYSTGLAFNRVYKPLLERLGLTYPQYLVIVALNHRGGQTVGELGEQLFLESNTLTPLLKRLEAAGLVARQRDSADERVVRVTLTERGRSVANEVSCIPEQVLAASGISADELARLEDALAALGENLRSWHSSSIGGAD